MEILWLLMAYIFGLGVSRLKLPPLVGYLLAGIILSFFGITPTDSLHEIGHLGVLFLLFTVGLHLRFKSILRLEVIGAGGIHLLISGAVFAGVAYAFGYEVIPSLIIGTLLGFSSTVLAAKALEARGELGAFHARVSIGILILQDIVAIVVLALTGGGSPSVWSLLLLGLPFLRPLLIRIVVASGHSELQLLSGLLLAIGGGALFEVMGLSSELGALAAGALLSGHRTADELSEKLWGIKEAFLIGFFFEVGLNGLPGGEVINFALLVLALLPLKSVLFFFLLIFFKLRSRNSFMVTATLSSYSEFTLIAGGVAAAGGFISTDIVTGLALITAASYVINAPLTANSNSIWARLEHKLVPLERNTKHPGQQVVSLGGAEYLVVGMGQAGTSAYESLKFKEKKVTGMEVDPAKIEANLKEKRRVVYGDAQDPELWENLDLSGVRSVILAIANEGTKVEATTLMRKYGYKGSIVALTMRSDEYKALQEAGATSVCLPMAQAGKKLAELSMDEIENSSSFNLIIE
ncbi:cation:proton antiporter [Balneola sp. MJW-20]|uniref:cation:proton antiporter domain-containing protein n=1 Tax=Gracilimonas aurantiaca TaxID=3234185 RepID=UPI003465F595